MVAGQQATMRCRTYEATESKDHFWGKPITTLLVPRLGIASGHPPGVISRSLLSSNIKRQNRNKQTRTSAQSCDESKTLDGCRDLRGCYWSSLGECKRFHRCESLLTKGDCRLHAHEMCVWTSKKKCVPSYSDYDYYGIDNEDDEEDKGDLGVSIDTVSEQDDGSYIASFKDDPFQINAEC
eukprot:scaffold40678_cov314-Skeletonema_marinoi.AAC.2